MEARRLLAVDLQNEYEDPSPAWYARVDHESIQAASLATGNSTTEWFEDFIGPRRFQRNDWIV